MVVTIISERTLTPDALKLFYHPNKNPTGRIPGTVMRFKIDKNLTRVAAAKAARPEIVAVELLAALVDAGMIEDPTENWGESVLIATGRRYVKDVYAVLAEYLYNDETHSIPADVFDAFCALIVWGDGDCPHCGGELEFIEVEGYELNDGDYYRPNSYVIDNYVYRCVECGEIIKTPNEL